MRLGITQKSTKAGIFRIKTSKIPHREYEHSVFGIYRLCVSDFHYCQDDIVVT